MVSGAPLVQPLARPLPSDSTSKRPFAVAHWLRLECGLVGAMVGGVAGAPPLPPPHRRLLVSASSQPSGLGSGSPVGASALSHARSAARPSIYSRRAAWCARRGGVVAQASEDSDGGGDGGGDPSDVAAPQLMGDWRSFRANLVAQSSEGGVLVAVVHKPAACWMLVLLRASPLARPPRWLHPSNSIPKTCYNPHALAGGDGGWAVRQAEQNLVLLEIQVRVGRQCCGVGKPPR